MNFATDLIPARLLRRYKRFLADMRLSDGREVVAHCPNPGSMLGLATPGAACWLSAKTAKGRKLDFGWELVTAESGALVGINTGWANRIVAEGLAAGSFPGLPQDGHWRAEAQFGPGTRFDFRHEAADGALIYLEVKSVTLSRQPGLAEFPDSRTERGAKHLRELAVAKAQGHRAVLLFLAQRGDCRSLAMAGDIDPAYASALETARAAGIEVMARACNVSPDGIFLSDAMSLQC
ncbi:DNA/RNA nuclease SfsA [Dongia sp.]|uniref:DNA/RNA nuclease SfsA n=1 Tax=Dongia sp. TaxID=1977262 RepID=UPI0035AF55A0